MRACDYSTVGAPLWLNQVAQRVLCEKGVREGWSRVNPDVEAPDHATVKDFLRWHAAIS